MANSRIGAETLTFAKVLTDVAGGSTTYDTPFAATKKLIKIGVKNSGSTDPLYADDQTVDVYVTDGDITLDIDVTDLTEDEKAILFGQTMSAGIRSPNPGTDVRPYFCVMWKAKKRDLTYKYYKILKVKFQEPDEENETKKEKTSPQIDKITGTGVQRLSDGLRKRIADQSSSSWVAGTGTGWFTSGDISPDTTPPTISSTLPAANATGCVISGFTFAWTMSEAILPALVTSANFFIFADVAMTIKDGTLSQNAAGTVITWTPSSPMTTGVVYKAVLTTGVKDLSANAIAAADVRKFTMA